MAFITAIDNAINKDHADAQKQADRDHELEMNKQFTEMMAQNEEMNLEYLKMTNDANAEADAAFQQYFGGGTTGGGTTGGGGTTDTGGGTTTTQVMTVDDIMKMFNQPNGGANFNADGSANFEKGAGTTFTFTAQPGPNFDGNGAANYTPGTQNPIPTANVDPFAYFDQRSQTMGPQKDPSTLFQNAGVDTSWMSNSPGGMLNMNDLIAFFDRKIAGDNRPAGSTTPGTGSTTGGNDSTVTEEPAPEETSNNSGNNKVNIEVDVDDGVSSDLKGELEDLALKVESAVNKGVLTEDEGKQLIRDLEDKANGTKDIDVDQGRVWGDPHFVGADGEKFDVQGEAGKTYNILSDKDLQVNAKFEEWGGKNSGATTIGELGMTIGKDQVKFDKNGELTINGEKAKDGTYLDGAVTLKDGKLSVKTDEYSFDVEVQDNAGGDHLNIENIRSENANGDGIMPKGLWGGTVDGDGEARTGDSGRGAQGGGAIEEADGDISARGDKETVKSYEVDDLFDTEFKDHNQFEDKPEVTEESLGEDIDRIYGQIDQLEAIQKKAGSLHDEIDLRMENGQISEKDAKILHEKVDEVVGIAKDAVLSPDDTNDVGDKSMSDDEVLTKAMSGFERLDKSLNDAKIPEDSTTPVDSSENEKVTVTITIERGGDSEKSAAELPANEKVDTSAVADQLKSLEWA